MPAQPNNRNRSQSWLTLTLAAAASFALGGACGYYYLKGAPPSSESGGFPKMGSDKVAALGRIEPEGGVLSLSVPTPDRIRKIKVHEDENVKEDQSLVVLDSESLRKAELRLADIQLDNARERLQAVQASGLAQIRVEDLRRQQIHRIEPLEIEELQSKIWQLCFQEVNAETNLNRFKKGGVAAMEIDKQRLLLYQIKTERNVAESQLRKLLSTGAVNRGLADARLQAARAELNQKKSAISLPLLEQQCKQAKERLKEAQVHAPCRGRILRILLHEGEVVGGKTMLQMANVDNMVVLAEVYVTDSVRVREGQRATITSRLFGEEEGKYPPLKGKVTRIADIVGKPRLAPLDPRVGVDNRVVEVKIELEQPDKAAKLIDHQVQVAIDTK